MLGADSGKQLQQADGTTCYRWMRIELEAPLLHEGGNDNELEQKN